jgi:hypothetical protein
MYVTGMTSLFNYGDHGPNKFSTTANSMMFYGSAFGNAMLTLFQRDRIDASEPTGLFWYDPTVSGGWWDDLPLDHYFSNDTDSWASMRSSWTDNDGLYVAIKAGNNSGHQTHNDLDGGDFVLDAMGQRFAGELGSGDYNAPVRCAPSSSHGHQLTSLSDIGLFCWHECRLPSLAVLSQTHRGPEHLGCEQTKSGVDSFAAYHLWFLRDSPKL